jgi:hypothetical protein
LAALGELTQLENENFPRLKYDPTPSLIFPHLPLPKLRAGRSRERKVGFGYLHLFFPSLDGGGIAGRVVLVRKKGNEMYYFFL